MRSHSSIYQLPKYYDKTPGLILPAEILSSIATKSLNDTITLTFSLKDSNKDYDGDQFCIKVGRSCKQYPLQEKNTAMENLLNTMYEEPYFNKRCLVLLLTYAGAQNNTDDNYSLLKMAVDNKDTSMIDALFEKNTNPNQKDRFKNPIFFSVTTLPIIKIFVKNKVDLNEQGRIIPHVLYACLFYNHPKKMIKFYLDNHVSTTIKANDGANLLHYLAQKTPDSYKKDEFIQIGILLINAASGLINELNNKHQTPLDIAHQHIREFKKEEYSYEIFHDLIALYKNHGGKTAKELQQLATK